MRALLLAFMMAFALTACANTTGTGTSGGGFSAPKTVYETKLAYQGLLTLAVAYNELPRCGRPTSPRICSDQSFVDQLRKADNTAAAALDAAESVVRVTGATQDMISKAIATANNAVDALRSLTSSVNTK